MDPLLIVAVLAVLVAGLALYAFRLSGQLRTAETKLATSDERASQAELLRMQLTEVAKERDGALQAAAALRPMADRCPKLEDELAALRAEKDALAAAKAAYERGESERERAHEAQIKELQGVEERLQVKFGELAGKALSEAQNHFLKRADEKFGEAEQRSGLKLEALLKPVGDRLKAYEDGVAQVERSRVETYTTLHTLIESMRAGQEDVRKQAASLVHALRGNPKTPGSWGEKQFENLLELSGLAPHVDFSSQESVSTESGTLRPDFVINLPSGQRLVVDIKCSLKSYLDAREETDPDRMNELIKAHVAAVSGHADSLAKKSYFEHIANAPDYVVMYIPGDNFFTAAMQGDPGLWERAARRRVIISSPSTFLPIAHSLASMWRAHKLQEDASEVARLGRAVYANLCAMGDNLLSMRKGLTSAVKGFNAFVGSVEGSVLPSARKFKDLSIDVAGREIPMLDTVEVGARQFSTKRDLQFPSLLPEPSNADDAPSESEPKVGQSPGEEAA